jgi:hypothetical protein
MQNMNVPPAHFGGGGGPGDKELNDLLDFSAVSLRLHQSFLPNLKL